MELILTNARVVTPDAVFACGTVLLRDGAIAAVDDRPSAAPGAIDLDGDHLLPGLVELHTDNMEKHLSPRPGVAWPATEALLAHDAQIAAAGITTVFDAVGLGDIAGLTDRAANLERMYAAIQDAAAAGATRAEHYVHLRCEVTFAGIVEIFERLADRPNVRLVSIMDHTPGQRQFVDATKLREYYVRKYGMTEAAFERFAAERIELHRRVASPNRAALVAAAGARGLPLASHDDATEAHVAEAVRDGMTIAEFPTTAAAARASHAAGLAVLVGAPNLVLGGSHSGNIAALDLARAGHADIVSSDYVPTSLLGAAFALAASDAGIDLPRAVAMVSANPARAVGMSDRGAIAPGLRADLVRVRAMGEVPVVREVLRAGARVA